MSTLLLEKVPIFGGYVQESYLHFKDKLKIFDPALV